MELQLESVGFAAILVESVRTLVELVGEVVELSSQLVELANGLAELQFNLVGITALSGKINPIFTLINSFSNKI